MISKYFMFVCWGMSRESLLSPEVGAHVSYMNNMDKFEVLSIWIENCQKTAMKLLIMSKRG